MPGDDWGGTVPGDLPTNEEDAMIAVLVTLIIIGVCVYLVQQYVPMAAPFKTIFVVVVVLLVCLWLLQVFGITDLPIPRVR